MDREDWLYAAGTALVSLGAGWFHLGAGLACAGAMLAFPVVLSMVRAGKGPPPK